MKILGANTLTGNDESLDRVPSRFLKDGDFAIVKNNNTSSFYVVDADNGGASDHPNIVVPYDDVIGMRWVLMGITTDNITTDTISVNTILSTGGIDINGDVSINGDVLFNNTGVPFTVSLNAEFLDGHPFTDFPIIQRGVEILTEGVDEFQVNFDTNQTNTEYIIMVEISNVVDVNPSIYTWTINEKQLDHFIIELSGIVDSPNYKIMWVVYSYDLNDANCGYPNHAGATPSMAESVSFTVSNYFPGIVDSPFINTNIGCYVSSTFDNVQVGKIYDFGFSVGAGIQLVGPSVFPYIPTTTDPILVIYQVTGITSGQVQMRLAEADVPPPPSPPPPSLPPPCGEQVHGPAYWDAGSYGSAIWDAAGEYWWNTKTSEWRIILEPTEEIHSPTVLRFDLDFDASGYKFTVDVDIYINGSYFDTYFSNVEEDSYGRRYVVIKFQNSHLDTVTRIDIISTDMPGDTGDSTFFRITNITADWDDSCGYGYGPGA